MGFFYALGLVTSVTQTNKNSYPREAYMLEKRERDRETEREGSNKHNKSINRRLEGDKAIKKMRRERRLGRTLERGYSFRWSGHVSTEKIIFEQRYYSGKGGSPATV